MSYPRIPRTKMSYAKSKPVYGVGINDADYMVQPSINGKQVVCPFYIRWQNMLVRCYSKKCQEKRPTYKGCTVVSEWTESFMAFRAWMEPLDWQGLCLDKDILLPGNKVYGPETCVFISHRLNLFLTDCGSVRGEWPIGVALHNGGRYHARCSDPFTGKSKHLGYYDKPEQANLAYVEYKSMLFDKVIARQTDQRIAVGLQSHKALLIMTCGI